jgi:hypothetical protein
LLKGLFAQFYLLGDRGGDNIFLTSYGLLPTCGYVSIFCLFIWKKGPESLLLIDALLFYFDLSLCLP